MTISIAELFPELSAAIEAERRRQESHLELIASENYVSPAVLTAQGSVLTNKYAEGYPGKRYYGGCEFVDAVEQLAIDKAKLLFGVDYANVQPHSGSQANAAVMLALLDTGDTVLGMSLSHGGHLTHGSPVNFSGKWFHAESYGLNSETGLIDYDALEALALLHKPKLIIAGFSAYSQFLDWPRYRAICDKVGAYLMADIAHVAGLVATGLYPSPVGYADVITTTTHKTLRGPRGGMILANGNPELEKKLQSAVFPGMQGGPLMHVIAAKAVAFQEALLPSFRAYQEDVLQNAKTLAKALIARGYPIVSGGTANHLMLVDLTAKTVTGKEADVLLGDAHITVNKNTVPNDPRSPFVTSGIRLGTPALTTRGFGPSQMQIIAGFIADILDNPSDTEVRQRVRDAVHGLCADFPVYR